MWVWFGAREAYHIGASGVIYGLSSFLFFSGVFKKDTRLLAISLLVVFLYGSMIWGVLPFDAQISWESHLAGLVVGFLLAFYYRHQGPVRVRYDWEDEPDDEDEENSTIETVENQSFTNLTGL